MLAWLIMPVVEYLYDHDGDMRKTEASIHLMQQSRYVCSITQYQVTIVLHAHVSRARPQKKAHTFELLH